MKKKLFLTIAAAALISPAWATPVTTGGTSIDNILIPDNDLNGVAETISLNATGIQSITDVQVTLNISDGFNGDFYAYLTHGSATSILLNRVGLVDSVNNPYGYSDAGFNVTLTLNAPNGDIHNYQSVTDPLGGAITGTFQADGRNVSPDVVTAATPRAALLDVFNGGTADGDWTLFIADTSEGGIGTLDNWSLQVTGDNGTNVTNVPDDGFTLGLLAVGFSVLLVARHRLKPIPTLVGP